MLDAHKPPLDAALVPAGPGNVSLLESLDRRRPGRPSDASSHLVPLLRFRPGQDDMEARDYDALAAPDHGIDRAEDDLRGARGIAFGLLLAVPLWAALVGLGWFGLHSLGLVRGL